MTLKEEKFLFKTLALNKQYLEENLGNSTDIVIRRVIIGKEKEQEVAIIYTDGLSDTQSVQQFIIEPLLFEYEETEKKRKQNKNIDVFQTLKDLYLSVGELDEFKEFEQLFSSLLSGNVIVLVDGYCGGFDIGLRQWANRGVGEPTNETVVRGPKEAFTESLRMNTALLRRKIKDQNLWIESKVIGRVTKTDLAIVYINGIAEEKVIKEVKSRLSKIDIDGILESRYIEEFIEDHPYSPFPTIYNSERPDVIAAGLLEGRVAIIIDGTPFVLLVPTLFIQMFQSAEDYYSGFGISSALRLLRYACFFIAFLVPALYIAVITFHQEMLPTELLFSLLAQREQLPFPAVVEVLLMEIAFEILREASLRMPKAVGSAISIVGTLVIGQAAVEAGLVSASLIIVVSITAIASFVFPANDLSIATRLVRFPLIFAASILGLYGIVIILLFLIIHLCRLHSFGVPYMGSVAPYIRDDQKDTFIRLPFWMMRTRPKLISNKNIVRENTPKLTR